MSAGLPEPRHPPQGVQRLAEGFVVVGADGRFDPLFPGLDRGRRHPLGPGGLQSLARGLHQLVVAPGPDNPLALDGLLRLPVGPLPQSGHSLLNAENSKESASHGHAVADFIGLKDSFVAVFNCELWVIFKLSAML
jgi:hypothetical protein